MAIKANKIEHAVRAADYFRVFMISLATAIKIQTKIESPILNIPIILSQQIKCKMCEILKLSFIVSRFEHCYVRSRDHHRRKAVGLCTGAWSSRKVASSDGFWGTILLKIMKNLANNKTRCNRGWKCWSITICLGRKSKLRNSEFHVNGYFFCHDLHCSKAYNFWGGLWWTIIFREGRNSNGNKMHIQAWDGGRKFAHIRNLKRT